MSENLQEAEEFPSLGFYNTIEKNRKNLEASFGNHNNPCLTLREFIGTILFSRNKFLNKFFLFLL